MADEDIGVMESGLGNKPRNEWPGAGDSSRAMDILRPGSDKHQDLLDYLLRRIKASEDEMQNFHPRWVANERKVQAYIQLKDWEKTIKLQNDQGHEPKPLPIQIPYAYATLSTIVTYLLHTFAGRRPIFPVGTNKDETAASSRHMETLLQYNSDRSRMVSQLVDYLWGSQLYGLAPMRTDWVDEDGERTVTRMEAPITLPLLGPLGKPRRVKTREKVKIYQGNMFYFQDPFLAFPDPNVPMRDCPTRGEFCFWRDFIGKHIALRRESAGMYRYVKQAGDALPQMRHTQYSDRALRARGEGIPGRSRGDSRTIGLKNMQMDEGTIWIIPREHGIGESEDPELWMFTILNEKQIVRAEPFFADHGMHPISFAEPYSMGPSFGALGVADYIGELQDEISWFLNSHKDNVRKALNDVMVINPSYVEVQDLKDSRPGKIIRLKPGAYGMKIGDVIQQLPVIDVTKDHVKDAEMLIRIGQMLSGVTENVLGLQDSGGRKTATEIRTSAEAAASRLASQAKIISAQGLTITTQQAAVNLQQFLDEEFYLQVVGQEGMEDPIWIGPEMISGTFHYPVHDGTLPLDRVALMDIWKDLFQIVISDQELRMEYSIPRMFEYIAELGGARNIESMKLNAVPDDVLAGMAQAGNAATPAELQGAEAQVDPLAAFQPPGQVPPGPQEAQIRESSGNPTGTEAAPQQRIQQ